MNRPLALLSLLPLAACSGGSSQADQQPPAVALVSLGKATQGNVEQTLALYGSVQKGAEAQYALSAPIEAIVAQVVAPVGSTVNPGDLVVRLTPSPSSQAAMTKASADARAAQQALARAQRLRADGLSSNADVETARNAAEAARAQQAAYARNSHDLALRARSGGHVETIPVNPGDIVASGATIATLTRTGNLRASFGVAPDAARQLKPGTPLAISPASGGASFTVPIQSIDMTVDPQTRLASVYATIPASAGLGPGQPLTAQAPLATGSQAVTIPYAALLDDGGQPYVYVVKGGVAHRHDVMTGASSGKRIVIIKGLAAGDAVVTAGGTGVNDGMKVRTK